MADCVSRKENSEWRLYDETFDDESHEVKDFEDLKHDPEPIANDWGRYGDYVLVGCGKVTDLRTCGKWMGKLMGCLNVGMHNHVTLDGVNHCGKVHVEKVFNSCDRPDCPVCARSGYAVRQAKEIEKVTKVFSLKFGMVEHIISSVPSVDYGLKFLDMKAKVLKILASRHVIGGCLIFHAFRYRNAYEAVIKRVSMGWYWAPHFHVLGFIDGGYAKCRGCSKSTSECMGCDGFEGLTRRLNLGDAEHKGDGYIVKVKGERKTIGGTAWYQLNHASFDVTRKKRYRIVTWFGVCGTNRKRLYVGDRVERGCCPICGYELEEIQYVGACRDESMPLFQFWVKKFEYDFLDKDGKPNWIVKPSRA